MSRTTPRFVALVQGFMAEVALGGVLLVWSTSPAAAARAPFGSIASTAVVVAGMVTLASALLALVLAGRLGTTALRGCVLVVSLAIAGLATLAIGSLFRDPSGPFILLILASTFGACVVVALSRRSRVGPAQP